MASVKKNFAYNSVLMVSNYAVNLLLFPYCARVLGVERFGTINFVQNIVQYFMLVAMMGISTIGVREIAKQSNEKDRTACFSSMFALNILYTFLALLIYLPLIFLVDRLAEQQTLFIFGAFQILFTTFCIEWFFRGIEDFRYITIRSIIVKLVYILSVICFVRSSEDYVSFFALTVGMTLVNASINFVYANKNVGLSWKDVHLFKYLKSTLSLGAYTILTSMYTTFNVAYLGFVWNDTQVAYYTTALKLYTIVVGLFGAFTSVMIPRMTSLLNADNQATFNNLIDKSINLFFTLTLPMVAVLMILAPEIVTLIAGDAYWPSVELSRIVIPMLLVVGIAQLIAFQVLIPKGLDRQTLYASIIGACIGLLANALLTPRYAAKGTCYTVVITECCVSVYYLWVVIHRRIVTFNLSLIIKHLIFAIPYFLICWGVQLELGYSRWMVLLFSSALCLAYFILSQILILKNDIVLDFKNQICNRVKL